MKKTFALIAGSIFFSFLFFMSLFTGNAFADSKSSICSHCHSLIDSMVDLDSIDKKATPLNPPLSWGKFLTMPVNYSSITLGGKTSGFITPFHMATLSGKPILYEPSEYLEEPGNPMTDEESIYRGTMFRTIKHE